MYNYLNTEHINHSIEVVRHPDEVAQLNQYVGICLLITITYL